MKRKILSFELFESRFIPLSDKEFHMYQIKDLFQDIIDEYGMDETPGHNFDPGLEYTFTSSTKKHQNLNFSISVNFLENFDLNNTEYHAIYKKNLGLYKKFISIKKDLESLDKRLKAIYNFDKDIRSDDENEYMGKRYADEEWIMIEYDFNI